MTASSWSQLGGNIEFSNPTLLVADLSSKPMPIAHSFLAPNLAPVLTENIIAVNWSTESTTSRSVEAVEDKACNIVTFSPEKPLEESDRVFGRHRSHTRSMADEVYFMAGVSGGLPAPGVRGAFLMPGQSRNQGHKTNHRGSQYRSCRPPGWCGGSELTAGTA